MIAKNLGFHTFYNLLDRKNSLCKKFHFAVKNMKGESKSMM